MKTKALKDCNKGDRVIWEGGEYTVGVHSPKLGRTILKSTKAIPNTRLGAAVVAHDEVAPLSTVEVQLA